MFRCRDSLDPSGEENVSYIGDDVELVALHSRLDMKAQAKVFQRPRQGYRKIVLSTNLAETSVTIEDVRCCFCFHSLVSYNS